MEGKRFPENDATLVEVTLVHNAAHHQHEGTKFNFKIKVAVLTVCLIRLHFNF
jgi:hypothetical protein